MTPFIAIAASVLPDILKYVTAVRSDHDRDALVRTITDAVQSATNESDPEKARQAIAQDAGKATDLKVKLAEIAAQQAAALIERDRQDRAAQTDAITAKHAHDIEQATAQMQAAAVAQSAPTKAELEAEAEDRKNARAALASLVSAKSPVAWAPPVLSILIVLGFFMTLYALLTDRVQVSANTQNIQIVNIVIGALTAAFATVISFWMGSSQGSKNKDLANFAAQQSEAEARRAQALASVHQARASEAALRAASVSAPVASAPSSSTVTSPPLAPSVPSAPAAPTPSAALSMPSSPASGTASATNAAAVTLAPQTPKYANQSTFSHCVALILADEGGYVDNPEDPGRATNMGITQATLSDWRGTPATIDDVKSLTRQEAEQIYRAKYWNALDCEHLPAGVDLCVFDFGVNAGVNRSARTLQQVVGVAQDGVIGTITLAAVEKVEPAHIVTRFSALRLEYYRGLKTWPDFGKGWTDRVERTQKEANAMIAAVSTSSVA